MEVITYYENLSTKFLRKGTSMIKVNRSGRVNLSGDLVRSRLCGGSFALN